MLKAIQDLLLFAEGLSGFPIEVMPKADLPTASSVRMARGALPLHVIYYRPSFADALDYLIALQCGFITRRFELPPEKRVDFASSEKGLVAIARLTRQHGGLFSMLPPQQLETVRTQLLGGLGIHVRSVPVCMRIDASIRENFPDIRDQQESVVSMILNENQQTVGAQVRQNMPKPLIDATVAVNAAMAQFWAQTWNQPALAVPYELAGYAYAGKQLLDIWSSMDKTSEHDCTLIDAWAKQLNVHGWFQWVQLPQAGS